MVVTHAAEYPDRCPITLNDMLPSDAAETEDLAARLAALEAAYAKVSAI